ncbi:hypothetical protein J437_LFUL000852 [Ladona fulva]|uniref:Uncharacterized protein n=1 Tax=Ladona fulva TaxID=123851 RepID=A0A8K0JTP7_LADFU|nr:hypothetical protein J437_LFUL000852 [Ladona fulva]
MKSKLHWGKIGNTVTQSSNALTKWRSGSSSCCPLGKDSCGGLSETVELEGGQEEEKEKKKVGSNWGPFAWRTLKVFRRMLSVFGEAVEWVEEALVEGEVDEDGEEGVVELEELVELEERSTAVLEDTEEEKLEEEVENVEVREGSNDKEAGNEEDEANEEENGAEDGDRKTPNGTRPEGENGEMEEQERKVESPIKEEKETDDWKEEEEKIYPVGRGMDIEKLRQDLLEGRRAPWVASRRPWLGTHGPSASVAVSHPASSSHTSTHLWGGSRRPSPWCRKRTSAPQFGSPHQLSTTTRTALVLRSRRSWPVAPHPRR